MRPIVLTFALVAALLIPGCTSPSEPEESHSALDSESQTSTEPQSTDTKDASDDGNDDATPQENPDTDQKPSQKPSGQPSGDSSPKPDQTPVPSNPHGSVVEEEGEVTAEPTDDGEQYVAHKRVTLSNGYGDAERIHIQHTAEFANITVTTANVGGYTYTYDLRVHASSESQARDGMDQVSIKHEDTQSGNTISLVGEVTMGPAGVPINIGTGGSSNNVQLTYDLNIQVPFHLVYEFDLDSSYSAFSAAPLTIESLALADAYSSVNFAFAKDLKSIEATLEYSELAMKTSPASGDWNVEGDFSSINIVTDRKAGYDIKASGTYNSVHVLIVGVEKVEGSNSGHHLRTTDYDERDRQVTANFQLSYSSLAMSG